MTLRRKDTIPGLVVAHFPPFDTLTTCPTCMGLACEDCCHTGAGTTVVERRQNGGGAMTPTDARLPAPTSPHKRRTPCCAIEAYRYLETHEDGYSPGWRLCGPDDVTVTVDGMAEALRAVRLERDWQKWPSREHAAAILAALSADKEGQK